MKKNIFLALILACITTVISAQSNNNRAEEQVSSSPQAQAKAATDKLNKITPLSAEQYVAVLEAYNTYYSKHAALFKMLPPGKSISPGTGSTNMKDLKIDPNGATPQQITDERDNKIKAALSVEQWRIWAAIKGDH
jgi:hypothetical protein